MVKRDNASFCRVHYLFNHKEKNNPINPNKNHSTQKNTHQKKVCVNSAYQSGDFDYIFVFKKDYGTEDRNFRR